MATNGVEMSTETVTSEQSSSSESETLIELDTKEIIKKSKFTKERFDMLIVKCTVCRKQLNHFDNGKFKKHPILGVIVCTRCFDCYENRDFIVDDDDKKCNHCRWCAKGGNLFVCDICENVFCIGCIIRNFDYNELQKIRNSDFTCYVCDSSKLKSKINYCDAIANFSLLAAKIATEKTNKSPKDTIDMLLEKLRDPKVLEPKDWLEASFSAFLIQTKKFEANIKQLKSDFVSKGHIETVANMAKVASSYERQIGSIMDSAMQKSKLIANASSPVASSTTSPEAGADKQKDEAKRSNAKNEETTSGQ